MRHRVRERRHARAEVVRRRARRVSAASTSLLLRRPADALEAVRDALEPLEVAAPCARPRVRPSVVSLALTEQLDPAGEAGERRAELVRRLARHARPDPLALGAAARCTSA